MTIVRVSQRGVTWARAAHTPASQSAQTANPPAHMMTK
jgi:hypothetical protein